MSKRLFTTLAGLGALTLLACSGDESGAGGAATTGSPSTPSASATGSSGTTTSGTTSTSSGAAGTGGGPPTCTLTDSGPIEVTSDGQVIENLHIVADGVPAIDVQNHARITIRNVSIEHSGAPGIAVGSANDVTISNVAIVQTGAPASGENPTDEAMNISCYDTQSFHVDHVRLTRGSSGIYLLQCQGSMLGFVEGHDFRGPFPRGQLVQWDKSDDSTLENFSVENDADSWPEDNVNVYQSTNVTVRIGLIDGNNSPSGVGVIFDGGTSTGLVEDVDAVHMGNGCFSDYAGADGNTFRRARCRDNICTDQGRGLPASGALMYAGHPDYTMIAVEDSHYANACNPDNIAWPDESFSTLELSEQAFTPRAPISLDLCWE